MDSQGPWGAGWVAGSGLGKAWGQAWAPGASVRSHVDATSCALCVETPQALGEQGWQEGQHPHLSQCGGSGGLQGRGDGPQCHGVTGAGRGHGAGGQKGLGVWGAFQGGDIKAGAAGGLQARPSRSLTSPGLRLWSLSSPM